MTYETGACYTNTRFYRGEVDDKTVLYRLGCDLPRTDCKLATGPIERLGD